MNQIFENQAFVGFSFNENKKDLEEGVLAVVKGPAFFMDSYSRNGRFYPGQLWENALNHNETKTALDRGLMFGCIGHPKDYSLDELLEAGKVSHKVTSIKIDKKTGEGIAEYAILDTASGRILNTILRSGSEMYVSTRAFGGFTNETKKKDGKEYKVLDSKNFQLESIDFVIQPGFLQTNPKLVESISGDLAFLAEDKNQIQCEDGICQLGEDLQKMNEDAQDVEEDKFEGIMDLPKEDIVDMLRNIVAENEILAKAKASESSDTKDIDVNEIEDTDGEDNKSKPDGAEQGDISIDAKLLSNYISYVELLTKLVRYNVEYEKYYEELIEFLDKDDKITTSDMTEINTICESISKEKDIDESIIVVCNKIINLTEKIDKDGEEVGKGDEDGKGDEESNKSEESFVEFMLTLTENGSDLLEQQMNVNKVLKQQIEHLKFASEKRAEAVVEPKVITETVEVEKIVEKEILVTPKEITEKLINQSKELSVIRSSLNNSTSANEELETLVEELTEQLEDKSEELEMKIHEYTTSSSESDKENNSLVETLNTKLTASKTIIVSKNEEIISLKESLSTSQNEMSDLRITHLASVYRVEKTVVESALDKFKNEDKIVEYIKKSAKKIRKNIPVVEDIPTYTPHKANEGKQSYLKSLAKG